MIEQFTKIEKNSKKYGLNTYQSLRNRNHLVQPLMKDRSQNMLRRTQRTNRISLNSFLICLLKTTLLNNIES